MLILDTVNRDCGWLPDQTIQLIANIYTIIKFLVPLLIIIMGSIDFLKAVMAQQEDQIKKAQSSFLQKLIAGALVFFVAVIVGWIVKVISDLDTKGETTAGNTFTCLNLMLNGGYRQNNKDYFTPGDGDKDDDNNNNDDNNNDESSNNFDYEECIKTANNVNLIKLLTKTNAFKFWFLTIKKIDKNEVNFDDIKKEDILSYCEEQKYLPIYLNQETEFKNCLASAHCTLSTIDTQNCRSCLTTSEVEKYKYLKEKSKESCIYPYMDNINTFLPACMEDFYKNTTLFEEFDNIGPDLYNRCAYDIGSLIESGKEECCLNLYNKFNEKQDECIDTYTSTAKTDIVNWYCNKYSDQC